MNRKLFVKETIAVLAFCLFLALFLALARAAWAGGTETIHVIGDEWKTVNCSSAAGTTSCW